MHFASHFRVFRLQSDELSRISEERQSKMPKRRKAEDVGEGEELTPRKSRRGRDAAVEQNVNAFDSKIDSERHTRQRQRRGGDGRDAEVLAESFVQYSVQAGRGRRR